MPKQLIENYKHACSSFATSICIVSIADKFGRIGLTINSFLSVTLNPPTILWSLDLNNYHAQRFIDCHNFNISLLASDQKDIAQKFACDQDKEIADKLVESDKSLLIKGRSAGFICHTVLQQKVGDHLLIIAEVKQIDISNKKSLKYISRIYC